MSATICAAEKCTASSDSQMKLLCDTCRSTFHCTCVSVKEELSVLLKRNPGFFWRCPSCNTNDVNAIRFEKILTFMENMTTSLSSSPPKTASDLCNLDNPSSLNDNDAMEVEQPENLAAGPSYAKRSRSLTPNIGQTVKSRKLNFDVSDPEAAYNARTIKIATVPNPTVSMSTSDLAADVFVGQSTLDLNACVMPKYDRFIYISQFKPQTSIDKIKDFIVNKLKCKSELITCQKLISSKRDPTLPLSFVSFKVGTTKNVAKKILKDNFWPTGVTAKIFEDRSKNDNSSRPGVSRITIAPPMPTKHQHQNAHHKQPNSRTTQAAARFSNPSRQAPVEHRQRSSNNQLTWRVSRK